MRSFPQLMLGHNPYTLRAELQHFQSSSEAMQLIIKIHALEPVLYIAKIRYNMILVMFPT